MTQRQDLIRAHVPGVSAAYSPAASEIVDRFAELAADAKQLDPAEEARLLSEMLVQLSGRLARLHGSR